LLLRFIQPPADLPTDSAHPAEGFLRAGRTSRA
jgi:hypothetical protein